MDQFFACVTADQKQDESWDDLTIDSDELWIFTK